MIDYRPLLIMIWLALILLIVVVTLVSKIMKDAVLDILELLQREFERR